MLNELNYCYGLNRPPKKDIEVPTLEYGLIQKESS